MLVSEDLKKALAYAGDEALRTGWTAILPEHLLLGLVRGGSGNAVRAVLCCGTTPEQVRRSVDKLIFKEEALPFSRRGEVRMALECENILRDTMMLAFKDGRREAEGLHLLRALLDSTGNHCPEILAGEGVSAAKLEFFKASQETEGAAADTGRQDKSGNGSQENRYGEVRCEDAGNQYSADRTAEEIAEALAEQIERCRAFLLSGSGRFPN